MCCETKPNKYCYNIHLQISFRKIQLLFKNLESTLNLLHSNKTEVIIGGYKHKLS